MTEQVFGSCNTYFQMRILGDQILRQARPFFHQKYWHAATQTLGFSSWALWRAGTFKSPVLHWFSHFPVHQYLLSSLKVKTKEYAMHLHHFAVGYIKSPWSEAEPPPALGVLLGLAKDIYSRVWSLIAAAVRATGLLQAIIFCMFCSLAPSMCIFSVLTP